MFELRHESPIFDDPIKVTWTEISEVKPEGSADPAGGALKKSYSRRPFV